MKQWFTYSNECLLVNRETVRVVARALLKYRHYPQYEFWGLADSITNRWALELKQVSDVRSDVTLRDSLAERFLSMVSPRFRVLEVIVIDLKATTEHEPKPKPQPKPRELTEFEKALNGLNESDKNKDTLLAWWKQYLKDHPGGEHTNEGKRLKNRLERLMEKFVGEMPRDEGWNFGWKKKLY